MAKSKLLEKQKTKWNKWWSGVGIAGVIAFLLLQIFTSFLDRFIGSVFDFFSGNKSQYIAVVMSNNGKAFTIPTEFLSGFGSESSLTSTKGKSIQIRYKDDLLSEKHAKTIASGLFMDKDCILVIGNSNSQLTKATLEEFLRMQRLHKEYPPAYILPIATATEILSIAKEEKHEAVLRMVPDNDNQASVIKTFAANKKVVILVDEENRIYSDDLSKSIAHNMNKNNGRVIAMKTYGNTSRFTPLYRGFDKKKLPELIIFVGVSNNGLLLIDELLHLDTDIPVIFTDGCTVDSLIKKASSLKGDKWVLSAVTLGDKSNKPTYKPIGKDAYELVKRIVDGTKNCNRNEIYEYIKENKSYISYKGGDSGDYHFNDDGDNKKMVFHIYRVKANGELALQPGY
jgi:ABC-type branched-subunit amino acid transport system substrate-binding protein